MTRRVQISMNWCRVFFYGVSLLGVVLVWFPECAGQEVELQAVEPQTISFQEVTPGDSKEDDVLQLLGEPLARRVNNRETRWEYGGNALYSRVEVILESGLVQSIVLHLESPSSVAAVVKEFELGSFRPAPVRASGGTPLGLTYPERGVLLSYGAGSPPPVTSVILEPISGDTFALRAQLDTAHRYSDNLRDLDTAIRLDARHADAHWMRAELRRKIGEYTAALSDVEAALRLDSGRPEYRLLRAELLYLTGDVDRALKETRSLISRSDETAIDAAAECLLGDFLRGGPDRDPKLALEHHQKAVQLATQLVNDTQKQLKRAGRSTLIRAYLGAANDIALGKFSNKREMVPKWIDNALKLIRETPDQDRLDPSEIIWGCQLALSAITAMGGYEQTDNIIEELFDSGRERIADAQDPLHQKSLEWLLGEAITEAAHYEFEQGNTDRVLTYADNAVALLEPLAESRPASRHRDYLLAKAYYFVGSAHALKSRDFTEAVGWYEKAASYLSTPSPPHKMDDQGMLGERMVSMGVAYWELDDLPSAMKLTKEGVRLMDQAVNHGLMNKASLAIPYTNLAAMYEAQGKVNEAETLTEMARRLNAGSSQRKP